MFPKCSLNMVSIAAEELGTQLAEFAFFESADFADDAPHARTRSVSERQDRDVSTPSALYPYANFALGCSHHNLAELLVLL